MKKNIWYVNPWDALPGEPGFNRSIKFIDTLLNHNTSVIWWQTSFSHATKKFRNKEQHYKKENFKLICLPAFSYKSHTGLRRLFSNIFFSLSFITKSFFYKKPDVIFLSGPIMFVTTYIWFLKRVFGCKIVIELRDLWPEGSINYAEGIKKKLFKFLSLPLFYSRRKLFQIGDSFIYLNEKFREYAEEIYPEVIDKPKVVSYPSPFLDFSIIENYNCSYEKKEGEIWGVFSGTLGASHDHEIILRALAQLKNQKSLKIFFTGNGPNRSTLEKIKTELNLTNVVFTGYLDIKDYLSILKMSDFALSFYHSHSPVAFPTKIIDYILADLPIIMSNSQEAFVFVLRNNSGIALINPTIIDVEEALDKMCQIDVLSKYKSNAINLKEDFLPVKQISKMVDAVAVVSSI